jgi:hypothetical protein
MTLTSGSVRFRTPLRSGVKSLKGGSTGHEDPSIRPLLKFEWVRSGQVEQAIEVLG